MINKYIVLCLVLPVRQAKRNFFETNRYGFFYGAMEIVDYTKVGGKYTIVHRHVFYYYSGHDNRPACAGSAAALRNPGDPFTPPPGGQAMPLHVLLLLVLQTATATTAVAAGPAETAAAASPPAGIAVAVKPSLALATLSGAMNGAGMEELNHEIYGGVYSQMIHGESFEEPIGADGVSGQRFTNTWSASRGHLGDDGNSSYLTWQPTAPNQPGCSFNASSTALNGNRSQRMGCSISTCSCAIINRGVDATGFTFDGTTSLEGYLFAQLPTGSSGGAVSVAVELVDESVRGHCIGGGPGCPVLAGQTIALDPTATGRWQRLNISLSGIKGATRCTNGSGVGPSFVRCVGQYGGGNLKYFPVQGHMYEENVCLTCSGSVRLRVESTAGATVLLDQFFLSPASVYGGDVARLPARLDVGKNMEQAWQALRFGGGTADGATYRWKQWRGPRWLRPPMANRAYAWHTNGFMAFETLELAEKLGLNETVINLNEREMSEDCSDFVEYVYGPTTSNMGALRKQDGRAESFKPFRVELGNEEGCSPEFVANVARCASAMVSKAQELKLPFKLKFAVGGPYEIAELTDRAMAPMVQALKPLKNHSDWLWDFHINGQSRGLIFELHKQPRTARNLTNAEYHQSLLDNFTRWQRFFNEPSSGAFFKCGVFEQNGGTHDMGRALGNARNSVTLQSLGNSVRMVTGANALQLMGHNDNGWDQAQIMVTPNASILTPYGQSNRLLKDTFQSTVVHSSVTPMNATNSSECFFLATRNDSALNLRVVNLNTSAIRVHFSWAGDACSSSGGDSTAATVRVLSADSLEAVNTPAQPDLVSIVDGAPLSIVNNSVEYSAPKFSISVITVAVDCVAVGAHRLKTDDAEKRGIRWAVNEPAAVAPWLLHGATGWGNSSQKVSSASVGIIVQPVFSITTVGKIVVAYPDKLQDGSLAAYAAAGHDIILLIGPWVGSVGGFVDRSGGYTGPTHSGLNCSSLTTQAVALAKHCVLPDQIILAALARKEAFAKEFLALLKANRATGFGTDWETSYGNNQTNAAALWGYVKSVIKPHSMKFMPWINNGGGGNMGPSNYAYCNDYFPLLPFADSLLNMGSYGAVGYSFGPGNPRKIDPVLCTNRSAGVVEPSSSPGGRWCGLGGTVKDILTHGGRKAQLSPGIWMSGCCSGSGSASQLCRHLGPVSTTTTRGWTQKRLREFLAYVSSQGATTVTIWSGLESSKKPWNATFPTAVNTCPWFVPTLLDWVA